MDFNWYVVFASGLIPLIVGFIWYNPKVFGTAWMNVTGMTHEKAKNSNMPLVFGLTLLFGMMLAVAMAPLTIHQMHLYSIFQGQEAALADTTSEIGSSVNGIMTKYGHNFRTFKHGAFHGILSALFIVLPILGTNALFEQKSFKYVAIHVGYWMTIMALMGGVVCQWA